ncbi:MAG: type II toxin-antitoxin system VapC family toxin [Gaiellaceae bacterium]
MVVVDASAIVALLLGLEDGPWVDERIRREDLLHAPTVIDYEVASALRGVRERDRGLQALDDLASLQLLRHPAEPLLRRVWELRHRFSAYDASYVALAEGLRLPLLTLDRRLARAAGELVPIAVPSR